MKISPYWKSVVAFVGALAVAAETVIGDNFVSPDEWVNVALAVVTAVGVYFVKNDQTNKE